jgi:hypothetical protein
MQPDRCHHCLIKTGWTWWTPPTMSLCGPRHDESAQLMYWRPVQAGRLILSTAGACAEP